MFAYRDRQLDRESFAGGARRHITSLLTMVLNFVVVSNRVERSEHTETVADFIVKTMMF